MSTSTNTQIVDTNAMRSYAEILDASSNATHRQAASLLRRAALELDETRPCSDPLLIVSPQAPEMVLDAAHVIVAGIIEPHADPVYGSLFKMPEAVRFIGQ